MKKLLILLFICSSGASISQKWAQLDLSVTTFRNGDTLFHAQTDQQWQLAGEKGIPAYCYYDNDSLKGVLYNFHAVSDERILAPHGYKIPDTTDFIKLLNSNHEIRSNDGSWKESEIQKNDFNAPATGYRDWGEYEHQFVSEGYQKYYWTTTSVPYDYQKAFGFEINFGKPRHTFIFGKQTIISNDKEKVIDYGIRKEKGLSIRCVMNEPEKEVFLTKEEAIRKEKELLEAEIEAEKKRQEELKKQETLALKKAEEEEKRKQLEKERKIEDDKKSSQPKKYSDPVQSNNIRKQGLFTGKAINRAYISLWNISFRTGEIYFWGIGYEWLPKMRNNHNIGLDCAVFLGQEVSNEVLNYRPFRFYLMPTYQLNYRNHPKTYTTFGAGLSTEFGNEALGSFAIKIHQGWVLKSNVNLEIGFGLGGFRAGYGFGY